MSRQKKKSSSRPNETDLARDELFSHIHRCGVLRATREQQVEWMEDTIEYIGECFPSLSEEELDELKAIGLRFCAPVIANSDAPDANADDAEEATAEEVSAA